MKPKPDRETLRRAVRWARLPGHGNTVAETREKFGLSASEWRKAVREFGDAAPLSTDEEFILAGLHPKGPVSIQSLIFYYGWVNHAGITPEQVRAVLARLMKQGLVRRAGERFELAREWP